MNKPDTCPGYSADIDTEYNLYSYFALKILRYLETLQFSLSYDVKSRIFHYTFSSG